MKLHRHLATLATFSLLLFALGSVNQAHAERRKPLDATQIRQVMSKYTPKVRQCYLANDLDEKGSRGTVNLALLVRAGGQVAAVEVEVSKVEGKRAKEFSACVSAQAKRWRFPKSSYQTLVKYPMMFLHTKSAGAGPETSGKGGASGQNEQTAAHE